MAVTFNDLSYVRHFADKCCEGVTRAGISQPCDKIAVAVTVGEGQPYPVCAYHSRARAMVPLADLIKALDNHPSTWL